MFTTVKPVTLIALTAVNAASIIVKSTPLLCKKGILNTIVPRTDATKSEITIICTLVKRTSRNLAFSIDILLQFPIR